MFIISKQVASGYEPFNVASSLSEACDMIGMDEPTCLGHPTAYQEGRNSMGRSQWSVPAGREFYRVTEAY